MADNAQYGNAYDENDNYGDGQAQPQEQVPIQQTEPAKQPVTQDTPVANTQAPPQQDAQKDVNDAPPPPNAIVKFCNWLPLRYLAFLGGLGLLATSILTLIFANNKTFVNIVVFVYLMFFGIVVMFIESPTWKCTRKCQLRIFFWFKLLSRSWGRASFYIFISFLTFSQVKQTGNQYIMIILAGVYVNIIAFLMYIFSLLAAKKYVVMYNHMVKGEEGDAAAKNIMQTFDILDKDEDGKIGSIEIHKLADDAGRHLSNAERHAIQTFLDESCNGHVTKEDWMKQWLTYNPYAQKIRFV